MATNDFLVFGGGAGANVMTQADWLALAQRLSGFQSGIARSEELNKAWRQSSIMAAVLGQLVADITGADVIDDGTIVDILANLKAAVSAQSPGVAGAGRNIAASVPAASAIVTVTASVLQLQETLGGKSYSLGAFSQAVNLGTVGAGGMDTGAAPANGYVALYAGYNPATGDRTLFGQNSTSSIAGEIYGGANAPAGFTATCLVGVLPTNGSGQFKVCLLRDRRVSITESVALASNVNAASPTSLSISGIVPQNATTAFGSFGSSSTAATSPIDFSVGSGAGMLGVVRNSSVLTTSGQSLLMPFPNVALLSPQTLYYTATVSAGTPTHRIVISGYHF